MVDATISVTAPLGQIAATSTKTPAAAGKNSFGVSPLLPTPTPELLTFPPTPTGPTPTLSPSLASLRIYYRRDQQLWFWQNGLAQPLPDAAPLENFIISPDHQRTIIQRNNDLWVSGNDGSDMVPLVRGVELAALHPTEADIRLSLKQWIPNTHQLLFSASPYTDQFADMVNHLYVVDVDTHRWRAMIDLRTYRKWLRVP